jgi:guanylate kinase
MPMLAAGTSRRLGKNLRALGGATALGGAAAGVISQWDPAIARADWDPRVAIGTMAGLAGAAVGGPGGLAAMAVAGSLITINPNLTGSGPRAVVVAGPSGVGKGTLINMLMKDMEGKFGFSVSHATRKPRPGEVDGESYHFVTVPAMEAAIKNGEFIEYAPVHGNYYGTSKKSVADVCEQGKVCILDIDIQGVKSVHDAWSSEPVRPAAVRRVSACRSLPSVPNRVAGCTSSDRSSCSSSPLRKKRSRLVYAVAGQRMKPRW